MKNVFKRIKKAMAAAQGKLAVTQAKLKEEDGQFVMDHAVVFVLIIALAGIALGLLTAFLNTDLAPELKSKVLQFMA